MDIRFKQWINTNKLEVLYPAVPPYALYLKYSMLPIIHSVIYDHQTFAPTYFYKVTTKEKYDDVKNGNMKYNDL